MTAAGDAPGPVSAVIPVHNGERFLREAIDSILAQSVPPAELIVVDDGSSDRTPQVARGYGSEITYVRQDNAGPAAARNAGLAVADGELIAFLDADDRWRPEKLERQLDRFGARPEVGVSVTLVQNFWEPEMAEEAVRFADHPRSRPTPGYSTVTMLTRRGVFDEVGAFNAELAHGDSAEWFLRCEEAGVVTDLVAEVLVDRRLHRDNRSRQRASASRDEFLGLLKSSLDRRRDASGGDDDCR